MKLIHRPLYLDRIKSLKGSPDIKIITGIRRSGKSKLMQAFIRHIEETEPEANIIYIDFTRLKYEHLKEYHAFNDYVEENTNMAVSTICLLTKCRCASTGKCIGIFDGQCG